MKKLLMVFVSCTFLTTIMAQKNKFWSVYRGKEKISTDKSIARKTFPKEFKLFNLNSIELRQELFSIVDNHSSNHSTIISLPNTDGQIEDFEVFEASNFEPELQSRFPEIRAFSGKGITDKYAVVKLSISPQGIQTMVFRTDKENEFIEPFSQDHMIYAVYVSQRKSGQLPWSCSTSDQKIFSEINADVLTKEITSRSGGDLKTMRLAQSVTAEYSNYFGATSASQVSLVLSAINATLTRCNGVYEKDLALHLNLISNTTAVIYYNALTDPYDDAATGASGTWNAQLQSTLTSVIGETNYDIGHLFGATGGGGSAGCIGCICTNGSKGSGFTSPADGIPQGDNFDIDYVVHEVGHQLGANHTFSHSLETFGVNKEIGSGITIMGYAGITDQDVAPHSIDIYHEASIAQIQANLTTKTCPVKTSISANNATPVVAAIANYTIPKSTPFALTGSATDANGDALTYCWEQNDNSTTSGTGSVASATKSNGPNWISFKPTSSPVRYFPQLSTILTGGLLTGPLTGGDAGTNTEALSSVARTLNFRLTVRDNCPYSSVAPVKVGQTQFTDMIVTVSTASGPFTVTSPNTAVSYAGGSSQNITWSVANTTATPVSCANVKISLSTDGGLTFPTVLSASTPNDGAETLIIPNTPSTTARIKVEAVGNIFFDISNTNFTIASTSSCNVPSGLFASLITNTSATISWNAVSGASSYGVDYKDSTSTTWITLSASTPSTSISLNGLSASKIYNFRVKTICSATANSAYATSQFTTTGAMVCSTILAYEPNQKLSTAATIAANTNVSAGIAVLNDTDYYKIITTATNNITITLSNLPADFDLYFYNSSGTQLGSSLNSGTTIETITTSNLAAGTYYIRVTGFSSAFNSSACYTLNATVTVSSTVCQSIYDNTTNGTTIGALVVPFNTNITGLMSPAADIDIYKFSITTPGTFTAILSGLPADYDLTLLNSSGTSVATSANVGTTGETITYNAVAGIYYVKVTGFNGANNSSLCYTLKVQLGTATKQNNQLFTNLSEAISLYPNPVQNELNILTKSEISQNCRFAIFDSKGMIVHEQKINNKTEVIDISNLSKGVYLFKFNNGGKTITEKFIKQ
jgi:hypothetical protein